MMECSQPGQYDTLSWFAHSQLQAVIRNGIVPEWFHGIISRKAAEELLISKPPGYFLIRVSESRIGYTLSYRTEDRCRHFMIDALEDGHYVIVGEGLRHSSLQSLVDFHRRTPIMPYGEVLTVACGQTSNGKTDYAELLFPQKLPNPTPLHLSKSHPVSAEAIPPALPFRPDNLRKSGAPSSPSQPNRLYPSLEDDLSHTTTSSLPAVRSPITRRRDAADSPPPIQPPKLPARSSGPPTKPNQLCTRTVSAPQTPTSIHGTKPSVVTNLKNLKKKFNRKRVMSQEDVEADEERSMENEYQEIADNPTFDDPPFSYRCGEEADEGLPTEYLPPPPFAPGY